MFNKELNFLVLLVIKSHIKESQYTCLKLISDLLFKYFAVYLLTAELFKLFEPLIGKKSIQYANGPEGRKRRQLMDRSFSHEAVKDYYEHFVKVDASACMIVLLVILEVVWGNSHTKRSLVTCCLSSC